MSIMRLNFVAAMTGLVIGLTLMSGAELRAATGSPPKGEGSTAAGSHVQPQSGDAGESHTKAQSKDHQNQDAAKNKDEAKDSDTAGDKPARTGSFILKRKGVPAVRIVEIMQQRGLEPNADYFSKLKNGRDTLLPWAENGDPPRWRVFVPEDYDPNRPAGVVVYINASPKPMRPYQWKGVLAKRNLIYISPDDAGNKTTPYLRIIGGVYGLEVLGQMYELDPDRFYVSGVSGGGRVASLMMWQFADVFTGGFPHAGANYPRKLPVKYRQIKHVSRRMWNLAKKRGRYAFYCGENDFNRKATKAIAQDMAKRGFRTLWLVGPGKGHGTAGSKWMAKGLAFLDKPLKAQAKATYAKAQKMEARGRKLGAMKSYRQVRLHAFGAEFGQEASKKADALSTQYEADQESIRQLIDEGSLKEARKKAIALVRQWGRGASDVSRQLRRQIIKARAK